MSLRLAALDVSLIGSCSWKLPNLQKNGYGNHIAGSNKESRRRARKLRRATVPNPGTPQSRQLW